MRSLRFAINRNFSVSTTLISLAASYPTMIKSNHNIFVESFGNIAAKRVSDADVAIPLPSCVVHLAPTSSANLLIAPMY